MEYIDSMGLLQTVMNDLASGQLIQSPELELLDLMGAIEIMDPRTDTFLPSQLEEKGLPTFDPTMDLTPDETLAIFDELLRLETSFHRGHPLASTLFACQYFRPIAFTRLSSRTKSAVESGMIEVGMRSIVLRSMLLGIVKSTEIVWEELSKVNVYDNEDVLLATAGINFSTLLAAAYPVSPLQIISEFANDEQVVTVDDVLAALDEAINWVTINIINEETREALVGRLSLRFHLVYTLAFLSSPPHVTPSSLLPHLDHIDRWLTRLPHTSYSVITAAYASSPAIRAIFIRGFQIPLAMKQPVRHVVHHSVAKSWEGLRRWVSGVRGAVEMWQRWNDQTGWEDLRDYTIDISRSEMDPYPRSLHASIISSTPFILFGSSSPLILAIDYFISSTTIPSSYLIDVLGRSRSDSISTIEKSVAREFISWLERVASALIRLLNINFMNRPRGRRWINKTVQDHLELIAEIYQLLPDVERESPHPALSMLPIVLLGLLFSQLLESILSGFETDLYSQHEFSSIYWVAERVAIRLESYLVESQSEEGKIEPVRIIRDLCRNARIMIGLFTTNDSFQFTSPFFPDPTASPASILETENIVAQSRLKRRFKSLQGPLGISSERLEDLLDWDIYLIEKDQQRHKDPHQVMEALRNSYGDVAMKLLELKMMDSRLGGVKGHRVSMLRTRWNQDHLTIALSNQHFLTTSLLRPTPPSPPFSSIRSSFHLLPRLPSSSAPARRAGYTEGESNTQIIAREGEEGEEKKKWFAIYSFVA